MSRTDDKMNIPYPSKTAPDAPNTFTFFNRTIIEKPETKMTSEEKKKAYEEVFGKGIL